jgi:hypothetical protein
LTKREGAQKLSPLSQGRRGHQPQADEGGSAVKKLFAAAGALGASVVISSSAMADTVTRTPSPVPTFTVTGVCLFPFQVHPIINNEYTLSFVNQNGVLVKQITTGALVITFTNLGTGKSITENVSGPSVVTFNSDGSVTVVMLGTQGGTPANAIGAGRTVFKIAADGTGTIVSQVGSFRDICSLLA